jgi:hypothetical protein
MNTYQTLTRDEKARLVMAILEETDEEMDFDDFQEAIGFLCEDIPGLEGIADEALESLIADCWAIYSSPSELPLLMNR